MFILDYGIIIFFNYIFNVFQHFTLNTEVLKRKKNPAYKERNAKLSVMSTSIEWFNIIQYCYVSDTLLIIIHNSSNLHNSFAVQSNNTGLREGTHSGDKDEGRFFNSWATKYYGSFLMGETDWGGNWSCSDGRGYVQ